MLRKVPLIVVLGSTGTGKTKLSIELAQRFGGEVISADSMQVYADLDIVTAKATKEEQETVAHHLLDVAKPSEPFTVKHFRALAAPIIDDLLSASKYPIVVGGTNYYIESLLWDILVSPPVSDAVRRPAEPGTSENRSMLYRSGSKSPVITMMQSSQNHRQANDEGVLSTDSDEISDLELETMSPSELHERLKQVDPISAGRLHPNNKRKILRALEVYRETGVPISEFIKEQRNKPGGNRLGGPLRYPHTILFWLRCDQDVLNSRLDKRVDSMLKSGLVPEVRNFYESYVKGKGANQYTKGILQSIGFKEFVPYLEKFGTEQDTVIDEYLQKIEYKLPEEPATSEPQGLDLLRNCLDELKLVTRRYSKKQIKWIQNRFLGSHDRQVPPLYSLDTSDVGQWESNVYGPAMDVIESYIANRVAKIKPMETIQHPGSGLNEEVLNFCDICKRHFVGEFQWKLHLASNKHKRVKDGLKKSLKRLGESGAGGDTLAKAGEATGSRESTIGRSRTKVQGKGLPKEEDC